MQLIHELLDYASGWQLPDIYLFTGNPVRRRDGAIVMGRGAALAVKRAYPKLPYAFQGDARVRFETLGHEQYIGWFQVKHHWSHPADIALISESTCELGKIADKRPQYTFHMNYPGVGNGRLTDELVFDVIKHLPNNVRIYR